MKTSLVAIFLSLSILFVASALAQNQPAVSDPQSMACGPANAQFRIKTDATPTPSATMESGKALVYVAEDQRFKGVKAATVRIGIDGAWVGATRGDSYLFFLVEPGEHHLCADWFSDVLTTGRMVSLFGFTAEPGNVYYFRARTTGGRVSVIDRDDAGSIDLDRVNGDEGKNLIATSPFSESHAKK